MNILYEIGINNNDIKNICDINKEILELIDEEVEIKVEIQKQLGCDNQIIKNIITTNSNYLLRFDNDILKLVNKLKSLGIAKLDITFDSNPFLLNYDAFEIDQFINKKQIMLG